jgi:hypothetical protein
MAATRSLFFILLVLSPRPPATCFSSGSSIEASEPLLPVRERAAPLAAAVTPLGAESL